MTGILVLSGAAAGTGLAPIPDPDDEAATVAVSSGVNDSGVVDQLDTWAETKGKAKVSPVGKTRHGNDKDRNRLR